MPVKAPDTSHVRHVDKSFAVPPGGQVCRYELVFLRAPCSWWGQSKDCTLHLMDCGHLRNTCRSKPTEPSGRFWLVCQGLRLETQDKGLSKEDQVNPRWIMGISDRCSYSPWVVAKHCFVIFLIECWAALGFPMKVESVRETLVIFLGGFIRVRYHQCMRFQFQVIFLGWISYLCQMSSVLVISMTRFFIDYCCSRSIVADVFIPIFIDFSYFSACVGCSLWILIHIFTPVNVVVSLDWPELPHRKGVWKYKWLGAIPMVRCGICAVSTLRMCFMHAEYHWFLVYWMRIWFAGSAVETVVVTLWLEFVFVFSLVDANSFVLVSWYFDIWNLFSREFVFAGATFECSFCRVIGFERIAPTAYDAVGDVMVWMAIRWEKCFWDFPETPLCLFGIRVCFLSSGWWKDQQRVKRSWARFSSRKADEKADIWRGRDNQNTFWLFLSSLGLFWMFWFLDWKRSMNIDFIWSCETRNWLRKSGNRVSETKLYVSHVASRFSQEVNWS